MPPRKKTMASTGQKPKSTANSLFGDMQTMDFQDPNDRKLEEVTFYKTRNIDIDKIEIYKDNHFRELDTTELEESIDQVGLLSPVVLITKKREDNSEYYETIAGSRRLTAVRNLLERALENNDKKRIEKYSKIFSIVLPLGATEEEIQRVYTDTNLLHRPPTLKEIFQHIDTFLAKDEKGRFINLPERRPNVAKYVQQRFNNLGYEFGITAIKKNVSIWLAHNQKIKQEFLDETLSQRQAYLISQMPEEMQDSVMKKIESMTKKEITAYINTYNLQNRQIQSKNIRSVDMISDLSRAEKIINQLSQHENLILTNKSDKGEILGMIKDLTKVLDELKSFIK